MSFSTKTIKLFLVAFFISTNLSIFAQGVSLYTPYTKISVPPGETVDYSIDVTNHDSVKRTVDIYISGLASGWTSELKSGKWNIKQLSLLPGGKKTISARINIPYKVRKGTHKVTIKAGDYTLPLYIIVSKQGNYETEFTCKQKNMQGHAKANFTFSTELKNVTGEKQMYALQANAPRGWEVKFKPNYKQATSVEVEPNKKANISIDIKPPYNVEAGTYKIPVRVVNSNTSSEIPLEVVITGTFGLELSTPTSLLSTSVTSGEETTINLLVKNSGSSKLENVKLKAAAPRKWDVTFEPKEIKEIQPGKNMEVKAKIKAYKKAITGDYVTTLTASTTEVSSKAAIRVTVKTSLLTGWIGILIILLAIGTIYYLFRKYGRR